MPNKKPWLLINTYTREVEGRYRSPSEARQARLNKIRASYRRFGAFVHVSFDIEREPRPLE